MNGAGAYDAQGPFLRTRGYYVHPIIPGTKRPGYYVPSENRFEGMENWNHPRRPMETSPQPGAGIGLRCGLQADGVTYIVAVDYDDDEVALKASEDPGIWGLVQKRGARGATAFFRSSKPVPSMDFKVGDRMVVQILADDRQTVIPGSIHPDTGKPYGWWDERYTLYCVNPSDLFNVADDLVARIETILPPGYVRGPEPEPAASAADAHGGDTFQTLNTAALKKLRDWVPQLGLYGLHRGKGRYDTYRSVASFRPSLSGKDLKDRNLHLSIRPASIMDHGEKKGYSPIQLAMVSLDLSFGEAVDWLRERVLPKGPDVNFEAVKSHGATGPAKGQEADPPAGEAGTDGRIDPDGFPASLGRPWYHGDPVPSDQPMLIPVFLPQKGWGYMGGQWGTLKTFTLNDMAAAIGSGGKFAGQQVAYRGAVIQIELEGSHSEMRLYGACQTRGLGRELLPIVHFRSGPPAIMNSGKPNLAEWKKWCKEFAVAAHKFAARHGVPLALVSLDPQNSFAGFKDEQSSAEGQAVSNALKYLSDALDCFVLVSDHLGKDAQAGLRGTSAKETNPLVILNTGETKKDVYAERLLEVRKMRNGVQNVGVTFRAKDEIVTVDRIVEEDGKPVRIETVPAKTLSLHWDDKVHPTGASRGNGSERPTAHRMALTVLHDMISGKTGKVLPPECEAIPGMKGVLLESWRVALIDKTVIEGKNTRVAFMRLKNELLTSRDINIGHSYVWMPVGA